MNLTMSTLYIDVDENTNCKVNCYASPEIQHLEIGELTFGLCSFGKPQNIRFVLENLRFNLNKYLESKPLEGEYCSEGGSE